MRAGASASLLLISIAAFSAQTPAHAQAAQTPQPSAAAAHAFSSELGFDLTYPTYWSVNQVGPVLAASQMSLDKESESDLYRRSIECAQNIFSARFGEPRSTFLAGAITTECMGTPPDLDAFGRRTITTLERRYQLGEIQFGAFAVQGQKFWVMRTTGTEHLHPEQTETIEYLATVLPKGLVYWYAHSLSGQAQIDFERAHLRLSNGVETDLIPTGALDAKQAPAQDIARLGTGSTSGNLVPYDTKASHHLDIGEGISYDVPPELRIFNTEKWEQSLTENARSHSAPVHPCYARRLVASPEDNSKQIIVTTYAQKCLSFSSKADNLKFVIANDTMGLAKKYNLRNAEYGFYKAGTHSFAVMRTTASLKERAWEADRYLTVVLTPISDGYAEFFLMGRTEAARDAMMATTLKLDDGAETALVPAGTFPNVKLEQTAQQQTAPAQTALAQTTSANSDVSASHQFNSKLGFSLDVPQDLTIGNVAEVAEEAKAIAAEHTLTSREQTSVRCAHILLAAMRSDFSRVIAVTTHGQECIGFPLNADTMEVMGESAMGELAKRYDFSHTQATRLNSGQHRLWAMRASIVPKDPSDSHRFFAVLLIPTTQGVAECMMEATTEADLDALMAMRLKFDDGAESALIPASTFAASQ
jgi:hypothetical protein